MCFVLITAPPSPKIVPMLCTMPPSHSACVWCAWGRRMIRSRGRCVANVFRMAFIIAKSYGSESGLFFCLYSLSVTRNIMDYKYDEHSITLVYSLLFCLFFCANFISKQAIALYELCTRHVGKIVGS